MQAGGEQIGNLLCRRGGAHQEQITNLLPTRLHPFSTRDAVLRELFAVGGGDAPPGYPL